MATTNKYLLLVLLLSFLFFGCASEVSQLALGNYSQIKSKYLGDYTVSIPSDVPGEYTSCNCSVSKADLYRYEVSVKCFLKEGGYKTFKNKVPFTVIDGNDFVSIPIPSLNDDYVFGWLRSNTKSSIEMLIIADINETVLSPSEIRQYISDRLNSKGIKYAHRLKLRKK